MNDLIDIKLARLPDSLTVEVSLPAGDNRSLESVRVILDGIVINPERGSRHHRLTRYVRQFHQLAQWFAGPSHQLEVTATSQDGRQSFASLSWTDEPTPVLA